MDGGTDAQRDRRKNREGRKVGSKDGVLYGLNLVFAPFRVRCLDLYFLKINTNFPG